MRDRNEAPTGASCGKYEPAMAGSYGSRLTGGKAVTSIKGPYSVSRDHRGPLPGSVSISIESKIIPISTLRFSTRNLHSIPLKDIRKNYHMIVNIAPFFEARGAPDVDFWLTSR
jgi:hypothetical protein